MEFRAASFPFQALDRLPAILLVPSSKDYISLELSAQSARHKVPDTLVGTGYNCNLGGSRHFDSKRGGRGYLSHDLHVKHCLYPKAMASSSQDCPVLVTGFGPFHNISVNASWVAVQELAEMNVYNPDGSPCKLEIREIPVEYEAVTSKVPQLWKDLRPRLCVHVGVSPYDCIKIEKVAKNAIYDKLDVTWKCPGTGRCVPEGPSHIKTQVDVQLVVTHVMSTQTAVKVSTSDDAGQYLCDFIYYTSLHHGDAPTIFIHVPPLNQPYSSTQIATALKVIIETILNNWKQCVEHK